MCGKLRAKHHRISEIPKRYGFSRDQATGNFCDLPLHVNLVVFLLSLLRTLFAVLVLSPFVGVSFRNEGEIRFLASRMPVSARRQIRSCLDLSSPLKRISNLD